MVTLMLAISQITEMKQQYQLLCAVDRCMGVHQRCAGTRSRPRKTTAEIERQRGADSEADVELVQDAAIRANGRQTYDSAESF